MNKSKEHAPTMYESIPAVAALNRVPGFEPVKLLRRTISPQTNEEVLRLDFPYKKLWFRLANPKGRIRLNALRITEQLAIFEAQVFLDRSDSEPVGSFTSCCTKEEAPGGQYIQAAQRAAMNEALTDAGYGLQFADVSMDQDGRRYGSEIPIQGRTEGKTASIEVKKPVDTEPAVSQKGMAQDNPTMRAVTEKKATVSQAPVQAEVPRENAFQKENAEPGRPAMSAPVAATAPPVIAEPEELPVKAEKADALPVSVGNVQQNPDLQEEDSLPITVSGSGQIVSSGKASEILNQAAIKILHNGTIAEPAAKEPPAALAEPAQTSIAPKYTMDTPVEQILEVMTFEEAQEVVVDTGVCNGWKIREVAERRAASLKFYVYGGYKGKNNILRAAARITLDALTAQKAG